MPDVLVTLNAVETVILRSAIGTGITQVLDLLLALEVGTSLSLKDCCLTLEFLSQASCLAGSMSLAHPLGFKHRKKS